MRVAPYIQAIWDQGGPFEGEAAQPNTRVTVQMPWPDIPVNPEHVLFPEWQNVGKMKERGTPIRWFQKADGSQLEVVVPNIKSVRINRSLEADADSVSIQMYNTTMFPNGEAPLDGRELGQPGFYNPRRGISPSVQARWGQATNDWEDVLVPNALVRVYTGFGGADKPFEDALEEGNLILYGTFLLDSVTVSSDGMMNLSGRSMAKLLIDQHLYHGIIPSDKYPLKYYRWVTSTRKVTARSRTETSTVGTTTSLAAGNKKLTFHDSSVDRWYPSSNPTSAIASGGYKIHGHRAIDCLDGNPNTYCLSVGNSHPSKIFCTDFWQFACNEQINGVYVHPWAGNYTMYISIYEDGRWQGSDIIPYDHTPLVGSQARAVDTGADIPYVAKFNVPWETAKDYKLPRVYKAQLIRVTFRNHARSQHGPWFYRCGMREFRAKVLPGTTVGETRTVRETIQPVFYAADVDRNEWDWNHFGYITASDMGQIDVFGDATMPTKMFGDKPSTETTSIAREPAFGETRLYQLFSDGALSLRFMSGDDAIESPFYGSPKSEGVTHNPANRGHRWVAVVINQTWGSGAEWLGYWVVRANGTIRAYGNAEPFAKIPVPSGQYVVAAAGTRVDDQSALWVLLSNGTVVTRGTATHYGNFTGVSLSASGREQATDIRISSFNDGYWILTSAGRVQAKGAAPDHGQITSIVQSTDSLERYYNLLPHPSDSGYLIMKGDGNIYPLGDVPFFGSPIPGSQGILRRPGNITDHADIVKDLLLWSGFWLNNEVASNEMPEVYGNIEYTGAFSPEPYPDDLFDKRPVIDAIKALAEAVGFRFYVDEEGAANFISPNLFAPGNWTPTGERLTTLPTIDERVNLMNYSVDFNDSDLRSELIISSEDPDDTGTTTITTRMRPQGSERLRGLSRPAMWVNAEIFSTKEEQQIMAEMISLHMWFTQRLGQATCVALPTLQLDDQVLIYERQTSEAFIHYVRAIDFNHDLDSGSYTMNLTTHWMGDGDNWAIEVPEGLADNNKFRISPQLKAWLDENNREVGSSSGARVTQKAVGPPIDPDSTGAADG